MKAIIEKRTQSPSGTWPKQGPDHYIAVQVVPGGVEPLKTLNRDAARRRGIEIIRCGEYYGRSVGPRSLYAKALESARGIAAKINGDA